MYCIYYTIESAKKYRSSRNSPLTNNLDEAFSLVNDLKYEGTDFVFIYVEEDTSRTTLTVNEKGYYVEIMTSATYSKTMNRQEVINLLNNFENIRIDPGKYSFDEEDIY
ncbi:hypothetical protein [Hahella sp. HN01]|uniref:hypothetical protein n=1 Tax=Hahella sp. HN01 TaxID=2847262 RepID=UPI001C1EA1F4|nr:hypothetical protein [Hahella sp. HN01]MBU6955985.1 hypothetical protein [Hahella sp. HN01]